MYVCMYVQSYECVCVYAYAYVCVYTYDFMFIFCPFCNIYQTVKVLQKCDLGGVFSDVSFHPRDMSWASGIFGLQGWACTPSYSYFGASPFAVGEARLVLSGSLVVGGARIEDTPGMTYAEKVAYISKASGQDLDKWVQNKGWACRANAGDVVLVPAGHIMVMLPTEAKAEGLRWGFHREADEPETLKTVAALIDTYPALRTTPYKMWLNFLSQRVHSPDAAAATPSLTAASPETPSSAQRRDG